MKIELNNEASVKMPTLADDEFRRQIFNMEYPIVFMSGFVGFTDFNFFTNVIESLTFSTIQKYNPIPTNIRKIFIQCEKFSSPHHDATTTFFQLMGGLVDYGAEEAAEHQHNRYGRAYPPQHPLWSRQNKIWIIAHSSASTAAFDLQKKLKEKYFVRHTTYGRSISALTEDEMDADMIAGIITVNANHCGSIIPNMFLSYPMKDIDGTIIPTTPKVWELGYWFFLFFLLMSKYQPALVRFFFGVNLDHWNIQDERLSNILTLNVPLVFTGDNLLHYATPIVINELNKEYELYDSTIYFSIVTQITDYMWPFSTLMPEFINTLQFVPLYLSSWYHILNINKYLVPGETMRDEWLHNDGVIAQLSQYGLRVDGDWSVPVRIFEQPELPTLDGRQAGTIESGVLNIFAAPRSAFKANHLTVALEGLAVEAARRFWTTAYTFSTGIVTRDSDFDRINAQVR